MIPAAHSQPSYPTERCESCRAAIIWCLSVHNRRQPLDALPTREGSIRIATEDGFRRSMVVPAVERTDPGELYYTAHHQTCPHGKEWQRKRKGGQTPWGR